MQWLKAFFAGVFATLVFHQSVLALLHFGAGLGPAPFDTELVPPFSIPSVLSLAFWGGVWGLPIWALMRLGGRAWYWGTAIMAGAIGPSAVALLVVFPLKGIPVTAEVVPGALLVNAVWGLGLAVDMKLRTR